jgi:hypothetical protein
LAKSNQLNHLSPHAMNELASIQETLRRTAARRRWQRALNGLWLGLLAGAMLYLLALAVFKLTPIPDWIPATAAVTGGVIALTGLVWGGRRSTTLPETARWVDVDQGLKERLSTALEVGRTETAGEWRTLIVADAVAHAGQLDPRKLVSFRLSRASRWALLLLAAGVGLGFVPEYRSRDFRNRENDAKNIQDAGRKLAELTKQNLDQRKPAAESVEKAVAEVARLGETLAIKPLTRSEALRDLASVADKLKDQIRDTMKDPAMKRLGDAARSNPGQTAQTQADLQKKIQDLQKELGEKAAQNPDALDKMKDELDKLQQAAKDAAGKTGQEAEAARQKMAQALASIAQQASDLGLKLPDLDEAMAALAAQNADMLLKDLQAAMSDMEKLSKMAQQMKDLQAQADRVGRDLAEQLKFGQADQAANRLDKMVEQLKSGQMSSDELQKLLDELSKAIKPASPYGDVAKKLKDALQKMQDGQKGEAGQQLADAAKELRDLMQQFGDCESMMAALDAMKEASMCIGNGQKWGLCGNCQGKGCAQCNGRGFGKGGKGGSGVGTWADNDGNNEWDGTLTQPLEDPGNDPRDQDARGITDRGEGTMRDDLDPSKIPGKFTPGGPMPSVTLKGVSIRGTSKLQYEEALTAAQSDAQSALSQDKVPRAYKDKVRDYFDDVKK